MIEMLNDYYHDEYDRLKYDNMIMFSHICNINKDICWKSAYDMNGFRVFLEGFYVGINTPDGLYMQRFHIDFWDLFNVKEIDKAPCDIEGCDNTKLLNSLVNKVEVK